MQILQKIGIWILAMKQYFRNQILKSDFLKNLATLISGRGIAQLIAIGVQPIIRRLYAPEDFGAFAVYISSIGIIVTISTLRYKLAIIPAEKDEEAVALVNLSFFINVIISTFLLLIIVFNLERISTFIEFPKAYVQWLYILPASIFLYGNYQIINYWLIRKKAFKDSAINKISRRASEGITHLGFGFLNLPIGLVIGDIVGNITNNVSGYFQLLRNGFTLNNYSLNKLKLVAKKYIEYPKYNLLPSLMNYSCFLLPVFFINKFYGEINTGYYDLSKMVLALPIAFVSESLSQVIFQKVSEKKNNREKIANNIFKIIKFLVFISVFGIIIFYFFSNSIFIIFFGENWKISGDFTRILMYSYAIRFIVSPLTSVYVALDKIRILSFWQFFYFTGIICLLLFKQYSILNFLKIYMLIDVLFYSINFILILSVIMKYDNKIGLKTRS